jgi:hypothetical protein
MYRVTTLIRPNGHARALSLSLSLALALSGLLSILGDAVDPRNKVTNSASNTVSYWNTVPNELSLFLNSLE